jgi:putative hydrolase of HD superfamily
VNCNDRAPLSPSCLRGDILEIMPTTITATALLDVLKNVERLKSTHRSAYTAAGDVESVAEHTWRLCLMAMLVAPSVPDVDAHRLLRMLLVHDLGEAVRGDVPAPEQARRRAADPAANKAGEEREDLVSLLGPLPDAMRDDLLALWDEYEAAATPTARLAKGLDKLETILQHTQGANPPGFDYRFNLGYGRSHTVGHPLIVELRQILDAETERRAQEADARG